MPCEAIVGAYCAPGIICTRGRHRGRRLRSNRLTARALLDRVDAFGIKSNVILDRGNRSVRCFVSPDSGDGTISAGGNAKVSAVAVVGAVGSVVRSLEQRQVHVLAWNVLDL